MKRSPMSKSVAAVIREAERWGVVVKFGAERTDTSYAHDVYAPMHDGYVDVNAPMHDGFVDDVNRVVCVCVAREAFEGCPYAAPALMHEVNHAVLGCAADEGGAMLALDHEAYRRLRLVGWSDWMSGYEGGTWLEMSTKARGYSLRKAYARAEKEKALVNGKPNYEGARLAHSEATP